MILHILNKAPDSTASAQMQQAIGEGDAIILIEEGVTAVLDSQWPAWERYQSRIYILAEDAASRGLTTTAKENALPLLGMDEFVALTEQYIKTVTWY
ncbi:MAG TPA: sulfurtransferase complex subunit TusB [Halomonas sp.]|nr:sulfurtransferase complex subunit TusB [Halomonas sp.]